MTFLHLLTCRKQLAARISLAGACLLLPQFLFAQGSVVTISKSPEGNYTLIRDGKPFFINGAGGTGHLDVLAACGGNSVRTWGVESLGEMVDGKPLIDRAQELGLTVAAGLWVEHERHGFNYSNQKQIKEQRDKIRDAVKKYKDHPALLMWGLGNEMEGTASPSGNPLIWKELNKLAEIVKKEDPNHPVMTVIAGASPDKIKGILEYYPHIEVLGVNAYSGASGVGAAVKAAEWKKPFVLTEFGPSGHWEVPKTSWGAPVEPSSLDKARAYYATQTLLIQATKDICLGSYVFLWGQKQEATSTWYGMFLENGDKLPTVDAMTYVWTGKWPANRSPRINKFTTPLDQKTVSPGSTSSASVEASDAEEDPLTYEWTVMAESTVHGTGGDAEPVPPSFPECIANNTGKQVEIKAPSKPGAYRLFVTVRDGKGGASKDNVPFLVSP